MKFHARTPGERKGIRYDKPNCTRIELPWTKVVKSYDALMESGRFTPLEELEQRYGEVIDSELAEEQPKSEDAEPIEATVPVQEESKPAVWEYNEIKSAHPENIVLYQVEDFFEIYGEDAKQAAPVLDLHLGTRPIPTGGRVDMCGIPAHQLEEVTQKLRDRFHVTIAAVGEDGQRNSYSMGKLNPEPPRRELTQADIDEAELGKPFPYEEELRDKTARLIFLDAELNLDANKGGQQEQVVAKASRPSVLDKLRSQPAPSRTDKKQKRHEEVR